MTESDFRIIVDQLYDRAMDGFRERDKRIAELEAELAKATESYNDLFVSQFGVKLDPPTPAATVGPIDKLAVTPGEYPPQPVDEFDYGGEWKAPDGSILRSDKKGQIWQIKRGTKWYGWHCGYVLPQDACRDGTWTRVAPVDKYAGEWVWCGPDDKRIAEYPPIRYRIVGQRVQVRLVTMEWKDTVRPITPALMREQIDKGWWKRVEKDGAK